MNPDPKLISFPKTKKKRILTSLVERNKTLEVIITARSSPADTTFKLTTKISRQLESWLDIKVLIWRKSSESANNYLSSLEEETSAQSPTLENEINVKLSKANDEGLVKLRVRGKGSGYKERNKDQESKDPLHLCVSSKYRVTYDKACELTEELINNIYEKFHKFQLSTNPNAKKLRIK